MTWIKRLLARTEFRLIVTIWLVYAVYVTPAGGVTPNRYVDLVHSIVNEGRFAIDTYHENTIDKAYYNGHFYAGALPGPAFLAVPSYVVFKGLYVIMPESIKQIAGGVQSYQVSKQPGSSFYGRVDNVEFFLSQLFLTLTVLALTAAAGASLLFSAVRILGYESKVALLVTIFYAFGSIAFFYSTVFFEQMFSATLAIAGFYLILNGTRSPSHECRSVVLLAAGFLCGCGLLVEYPTVLIAVWFGIWLALSARAWKPVVLYAAGAIIPVLILLAYNYALFGDPFTTPYAHLIAEFDSVHGIGFFGATYPHPDRLLGLLFGDERGLFLFAPVTLVGSVGLWQEIRKRGPNSLAAFICAGIGISYIIFFSSYTNWRGGAAFGPRYLIATLPLIVVGVAFAFQVLPKRLIYLVGTISMLINWTGAQFGFAASIAQHFGDFAVRGPTLPVFEAILSHSIDQETSLYLIAARYHAVVAVGLTAGLACVGVWMFRDIFSNSRRDQDGDLTTAVAERL